MPPIDPRYLAAIKRRISKATPAPWLYEEKWTGRIRDTEGNILGEFIERADTEFAAHARTDLPALIAALEAALGVRATEAGDEEVAPEPGQPEA